MKTDVQPNRINWLSIKWLQVQKDKELSLYVNYGFDQNEFKEIKLIPKKSRSKGNSLKALKKAYKEKLPISAAKRQMCCH